MGGGSILGLQAKKGGFQEGGPMLKSYNVGQRGGGSGPPAPPRSAHEV